MEDTLKLIVVPTVSRSLGEEVGYCLEGSCHISPISLFRAPLYCSASEHGCVRIWVDHCGTGNPRNSRIATTSGTSPLSFPIIYVVLGFLLFSVIPGAPSLDPVANSELVERLTELVVIISLMGAGLKLDRPFLIQAWSRRGDC